MRRKRKVVNWWKVYCVGVLVTCVVLVAFALINGHFSKNFGVKTTNGLVCYSYDVQAGDTLWSVASNVATPNDDVREIVFRIMNENKIKNAQELKIGDRIYIHLERVK